MKPLRGAKKLLSKACRNLAKFFLMLGLAAGFATPFRTLADEDSLGNAIKEGEFIFNGRLRYEDVSNSSFASAASGLTFRAPLATLHAFQGWADLFLGTPANGIEDLYFSLGYQATEVPFWGTVSATVIYHDFSPDIAGPDLGEEVDFKIAATPTIHQQKVTFSLEIADFSGSPVLPDVRKFWLTATLAF